MKLYDTGVYLNNGQEIIPAAKAQLPVATCVNQCYGNNY